jgi:hypothetical protein
LQYDSLRNEIGIKAVDSYIGQLADREGNELYLLRLQVKNARFKPSKAMSRFLRKPHTQGFMQSALYESLVKAMQNSCRLQGNEAIERFYVQIIR